MTLLLGAICTDGVVLAADRKFTSSNPAYGDKITGELNGILTGFSGDRGNFVLFTTGLKKFVTDYAKSQMREIFQSPFPNIDSIIWEINHIKTELRHHKFHVLMGVSGSYFGNQKSRLYHFFDDDGCVPIEYSYEALGSGEPYCSYLMKKYYRDSMKMEEFAQLADFVIRFVSDPNYDLSRGEVGLDPENQFPQIVYIPDNPDLCKSHNDGNPKLDCSPTPEELDNFRSYSNDKLRILHDQSF